MLFWQTVITIFVLFKASVYAPLSFFSLAFPFSCCVFFFRFFSSSRCDNTILHYDKQPREADLS